MNKPTQTTTASEIPSDFTQLQRDRLKAAMEQSGTTAVEAAAIIGTTPATFARKARKPSTFTTGEAYALAAAGVIKMEDFVTIFFPEFVRDALRDGVRLSLDIAKQRSLAAILCEDSNDADVHLGKAMEAVDRAARSASVLMADYGDPAPAKEIKAMRRTLRKIGNAPAPTSPN